MWLLPRALPYHIGPASTKPQVRSPRERFWYHGPPCALARRRARAFWSDVVAVHHELEAIDPKEARDWRIAAGKLPGGPDVHDARWSADPLDESGGRMPTLIDKPTIVQAAGNKPKRIEEFIGRVNSKT